MLRKFILTIIITLVSTSQSFAFDGERRGLFVDLGIGYLSYNVSNVYTRDKLYDVNSFAFNGAMGYAFDNKNPIVLEIISIGEVFNKPDGFEHKLNHVLVSWYHYLKPKNKSIFTVIGVGKYYSHYRQKTGYNPFKINGLGFVVGVGYEFAKGKNIKISSISGRINYDSESSMFYLPYLSLSMSLF